MTWAILADDDGWDEQFGNPLFKREIDRGPVFCLHCLDSLGDAMEEAMRAWETNEAAVASNSR